MASEGIALRLSALQRRFGHRLAVAGLDLEVGRGETMALLGPNGAGKTTTIGMLTGLLRPTAGDIEIEGRIGYCPQSNVFYDDLTVAENLRFAGALFGVGLLERRTRSVRIAHELGLGEQLNQRAGRLSGGQQRRLTLGLAMMHDPQVVLIEEPEAGLDPHSKRAIRVYLQRELADKTVLFTSHDMREVERLADRVAILDRGVLIAVGTPEELRDKVGEGNWVDLDQGRKEAPRMSLEDVFMAITGGAPS